MPRRITNQEFHRWVGMEEASLASAGRIAWQNDAERKVEIELFSKVTGISPIKESHWRNHMTWSAAVLLGLSVEQGLKALIMRRSSDGGIETEHSLVKLWELLPKEDHNGIVAEAGLFRERTAGTKFEDAPDLSRIEDFVAVIRHHEKIFETARYFGETKESGKDLTKNLDLWVMAMAVYAYAMKLEPSFLNGWRHIGREVLGRSVLCQNP